MTCENCETIKKGIEGQSTEDMLKQILQRDDKRLVILNPFNENATVLTVDKEHAIEFHRMISGFVEEHFSVAVTNRHYDGKGFEL